MLYGFKMLQACFKHVRVWPCLNLKTSALCNLSGLNQDLVLPGADLQAEAAAMGGRPTDTPLVSLLFAESFCWGQLQLADLADWGMAFNPEYCVVVDNDEFKNGAKIQLPPDCNRKRWSLGGRRVIICNNQESHFAWIPILTVYFSMLPQPNKISCDSIQFLFGAAKQRSPCKIASGG